MQKKYIVYNIFWQWISLLAQIGAVFSIAGLLGQAAILLESKKEEMFLAQGQNTNGLYMGQTLIVLTICVAVRLSAKNWQSGHPVRQAWM